ncbi:GAF domain-containing sensor histidine kinase [Nocardioides marmotae]|uniref:GAF domain-containing sensor histidine kinase n=1 Tax=Nocardioides marmotae TaxID=2663857 RepID=UPI0012B5969E|nr:GAF domain-containing protein [Nocardioides marmotae]MBC9733019.1 diguanylate cyclase [Nocardioides marmotae]MTB84133.1 diguanylate cyclase [Nocardioides marmotae]
MRFSSAGHEETPDWPWGGQPSFEDLMRVAATVAPAAGTADWTVLLEAVSSLSTGGSLDDTLGRLLLAGRDLTGAQDGTLTLLGGDEQRPLRLWLTPHGVAGSADPGAPDHSGTTDPPRDWAEDLAAAPEAGARGGQRPGTERWPTMPSVHAPILVGEQVLGSLRLTGKVLGSSFTEADQRVASALAGAAGVVIENARLREQVARREGWLSAASDLLRYGADDPALQVLVDWVREMADADAAWVVAGADEADLRLRVVSGIEDPAAMVDLELGAALAIPAVRSGLPVEVESLAAHPDAAGAAAVLGFEPVGPALVVPLGDAVGHDVVITLVWRPHPEDPEAGQDRATLPATIARQAPLVLRVARAGKDEQRLAVLQDRERIARDLHDMVVQQLFALGLELQGISWVRDAEEIERRLDRATDGIDTTIRAIRRTIFSLGTPRDDVNDPRAAIVELVERAARTMKLRPTLRFRGPVRSAIGSDLLPDVLAVLSEALSNAVRHANASTCEVEVSVLDEVLVRVTDDGTGIPEGVQESGLANVRRRAQRRGGRLRLTPVYPHGTVLEWQVPGS